VSAPDESKPQSDHERASDAATADPVAALHDLASPKPSTRLRAEDLQLLHAMQQVLEARQSDAWIEKIKARIAADLKWE